MNTSQRVNWLFGWLVELVGRPTRRRVNIAIGYFIYDDDDVQRLLYYICEYYMYFHYIYLCVTAPQDTK